VKLGKGGIEEIIEVALTDEERSALEESADAVRSLVEAMNKMEL
jgi:malate dehydrogenase